MQANAGQTSRTHGDGAPVHYERHRPEQSTLYRLVRQHAQSFFAQTEEATGASLPQFVKDEFEAFLARGILAHGFLRLLLAAQPVLVTPALQVVHRVITCHLLEQTGFKADEAASGAVTLIQRFGSAANLKIHLHCLVLDGVYLPHCLRPARRAEGVYLARRHAAGRRARPGTMC